MNPIPLRSSAIPIGQQNVGGDRMQSYPRMVEQRGVVDGGLVGGTGSAGPLGGVRGEMDDQNDAVFSPSSIDEERMMIIEKASVFHN